MKCIDLSHNRIGKKELNAFLESGSLTQNASICSFDIRYNPGATSEILQKVSYQLITNIANMQEAGVQLQPGHLKGAVLYHKNINKMVYARIGLKFNRHGKMFLLDDPYLNTIGRSNTVDRSTIARSTSKETIKRSSSTLKKKRASPMGKV